VIGDEFASDYTYKMPFTGYDINGNVLAFEGQYAVCIQSHTQWPEYNDFAYEVLKCSDTFTITSETIEISEILSNELQAIVEGTGIYLHAPMQIESLELLDMSGKVIYTSTIQADNAMIPLPDAAGIYFVRARFDSGFGIKKVLVTK
jgi:hypothetical protein